MRLAYLLHEGYDFTPNQWVRDDQVGRMSKGSLQDIPDNCSGFVDNDGTAYWWEDSAGHSLLYSAMTGREPYDGDYPDVYDDGGVRFWLNGGELAVQGADTQVMADVIGRLRSRASAVFADVNTDWPMDWEADLSARDRIGIGRVIRTLRGM